ncbi:hypothetical protein ABIB34_004430 [Rhodococcus sp. UYP5]
MHGTGVLALGQKFFSRRRYEKFLEPVGRSAAKVWLTWQVPDSRTTAF